jgi:succinate dehydrogenase/fumarate reductase flavoprotein subunit
VPGLYVAGDTASRENVAGALSGGGSVNSSWAIASGWWAGQGAAGHARRRPVARAFRSQSAPLGQAGMRAEAGPQIAPDTVIAAIRAEMAPLDKNFTRSDAKLTGSLTHLDAIWTEAVAGLSATGPGRLRAREAAAALAAARFSLTAARARTESRGMHRRSDYPAHAPGPVQRYLLTGPDAIRVAPEVADFADQEVAS